VSTSAGKNFIGYTRTKIEKLGIAVAEESLENLRIYFDILLEEKDLYNIVGKLSDTGIIDRLFLDSLLGLDALSPKNGCSLLDVGTGGGFPGLVLKIARPGIILSLLDASKKKIDFLKKVCDKLNLKDVGFLQDRGELLGRNTLYRDSFDIVTSKAFASMDHVVEICAPFVKKGGKLSAWKGIHYTEEMEYMGETYTLLNLSKPEIHKYSPEGENSVTVIAVFEKTGETPDQFPRSYQAIRRKPISAYDRKRQE
jgi:16S rRNA (guanine527-N7)-methyltransferase